MDRTTVDLRSIVVGWGVLIAIWLICSYMLRIPGYLLASPARVAQYVQTNYYDLAKAVWLTGSQAAVGWAGAVIFGIVLGTVMFQIKWLRRVFLPVVVATQTTPIIALAPLVTLWFGYGWESKTVISCVVAIFPIIVATYSGLSEAKRSHVYIFRLAGASELSIFWNVRFMSAWGALIPALKTAVVLAIVGSVVGEFMGGNRGLGFLIMVATYGTKSDVLLTAIICCALLGQIFLLALEISTKPMERRFSRPS